jgi:hypothetical protein
VPPHKCQYVLYLISIYFVLVTLPAKNGRVPHTPVSRVGSLTWQVARSPVVNFKASRNQGELDGRNPRRNFLGTN